MVIPIRFIHSDGETTTDAQGLVGDSLLKVAQSAGMPLEGTCEGQMACSTCHVVLAEEWFVKLGEPAEDEEDMLDLAAGAKRTSRLACQIVLDDSMNGLTAHIPAESRNMLGI